MRQRISRTAGLVAATAACAVLLAGCGQQDAGSAPSPRTTSSASTSASASPSSSPSPKTTKLVRLKAGPSVEIPRSWHVEPEEAGDIGFNDPDGILTCGLSDFPGSPANWKPTKKTIDFLAHASMGDEPNFHRAPDVIIHAVRMFHLTGKQQFLWHDEYGTIRRGHVVVVEFDGNTMIAKRPWQTRHITKIINTFRLG